MIRENIKINILALAVVFAAYFLGTSFKNRNHLERNITVTGLGSEDFTSDLIVWDGIISAENYEISQALKDLEKDKNAIRNYLISNGLKEGEVVFYSIYKSKKITPVYNFEGRYTGESFAGYSVTQKFKIESKDVESVERISREISELLSQGVNVESYSPRFYYTGLADLKQELIKKATEDARQRAENIAKNSKSKIGKLLLGSMGTFQITGQNSDEDYTWGGAFNTSEKFKTASITIRLVYQSK